MADKPQQKPKKKKVAENWDDDLSDTEPTNDTPMEDADPSTPTANSFESPGPPPPTPSSPFVPRETERYSGPGERQLKTDAVARRMIASALGVRSKSTPEQREYEASLKKKAASEREERKRAEEELEKAKRDIWED